MSITRSRVFRTSFIVNILSATAFPCFPGEARHPTRFGPNHTQSLSRTFLTAAQRRPAPGNTAAAAHTTNTNKWSRVDSRIIRPAPALPLPSLELRKVNSARKRLVGPPGGASRIVPVADTKVTPVLSILRRVLRAKYAKTGGNFAVGFPLFSSSSSSFSLFFLL